MVEEYLNCGNTKSCQIFHEFKKACNNHQPNLDTLFFNNGKYECAARTTLEQKYKAQSSASYKDSFKLPCHIESSRNALYRIEEKLKLIEKDVLLK